MKFLSKISSLLFSQTKAERLYHGTVDEDLSKNYDFMPMTHFGTLAAAQHRGDFQQLDKSVERNYVMPVNVKFRNSLELDDCCNHSPSSWRHIMMVSQTFGDVPPYGKTFGKGRELLDMDKSDITPEYHKHYITVLEKEGHKKSDDILKRVFDEPREGMSYEDVVKELQTDTLFDEDSVLFYNDNPQEAAAIALTMQRMIQELETRGYDSVKYDNRSEDIGNYSYISFRPKDQVFRPHKVDLLPSSEPKFDESVS